MPSRLSQKVLLEVTSRYYIDNVLIDNEEIMNKNFFSALILILLCCSNSYSFSQAVTVIAEGLEHPWSLAFMPDGRYLVTEKKGNLRIIDEQGNIIPPISGLPKIATIGQGGLLDVILHPQFEKNHWIYLRFVSGNGVKGYSTEVVRANINLQKDNLSLSNIESIFQSQPKTKGGRHFGSRLLFDKKQYLYISLGDRGLRDPAQELINHIGSLIRLHDDGKVPNDNPFVDQKDARPEIFSYGHRNIQGLALHPQTGDVWAHEHGPQGGDELNRIVPGKNYGWPVITYGVNYGFGTKIGEGTHKAGMEQPRYQWTPSIAPSGLAFYNDSWLIGALKHQLLAVLSPDGNRFSEKRFLEQQWGKIRDVRVKGSAVYLLTDDDDGKLLRVYLEEKK